MNNPDSRATRVGFVAQPFDGVLPPRQNSIGLIVYNSALGMARAADVTIFLKNVPDKVDPAGFPFRVRRVGTPLEDGIAAFVERYPRWAGRLGIKPVDGEFRSYARNVARALRRQSCSVVHVMNYWQWCRTLRSGRCRVVLEMQSEWLAHMDKRRVEHQLEAVDAVVGVSEHISRQFRSSFPGYKGVVATAYNGVDVDSFKPRESSRGAGAPKGRGEFVILFVGRLSPEKGVHVLLAAFAEVLREIPDAVLELAGPRTQLSHQVVAGLSADPLVAALKRFYDGTVADNYQKHLDALVLQLGLEGRVRFLGSLPHADLVMRYQLADVVVNPSLSESFGISIVEGMASELPVIGTRIGGMQETIIDGETGVLVAPERPDEISTAILELRGNPTRAAAMGRKGRARAAEHFSWRARCERLLDVYRKVLEGVAL